MPINNKNVFTTKIAYHIYTWMAIFIVYSILVFFNSEKSLYEKLTASLSYIILFAIIPVYTCYAIHDRLIYRKQYVRYFLSIGALALLFGTFSYYYFKIVFDSPYHYAQWLGNAIFIIVLAIAIKMAKQSFKDRFLIHEIKAQHLESELTLLKSQIDPHFFFNTLNNLYALSLMKSEEVPAAILKLSELMRYVLESSKMNNVELIHEHEFLQNYLYLQKFRFSNSQNIQYTLEGEPAGKLVAPMLFIPFVENSFKHGTSAKTEQFFIHITLKVSDHDLIFAVSNSKPTQADHQQADSIKLGLHNVKRRLELLYPDKHVLEIADTPDKYQVTLRLQL